MVTLPALLFSDIRPGIDPPIKPCQSQLKMTHPAEKARPPIRQCLFGGAIAAKIVGGDVLDRLADAI
jgi:hypothetical protein